MPRSSMAALISETRVLIADLDSSPVFSDGDIQNALDRRRCEQRHIALIPSPTFQPGGAVLFEDFYANIGWWEDDILLQDVAYNTVTPSVSEPIVGHWHFATQPAGFGVRATGKTYDLYGSAADLLEAWAATLALEFDVQEDRDSYTRSQKQEQLRALAQSYRAQALASTTIAAQSELMSSDGSHPAVTYPTYADDVGW